MKITLPPFLSAETYTIYSSNRISTSHKNHNILQSTNNYTVHLTRQRRAPRSQEIRKSNKSTSVSTENGARIRVGNSNDLHPRNISRLQLPPPRHYYYYY